MKKFFVLGSDIGYSLSPTIFSHLFKFFGDKAEYSILDIPPQNLSELARKGFDADGFNVTKPFKTEIIKYLNADCSDCGSVNTVTTRDMKGYSTDGAGFLFDLERNFSGASSSNLLVLGYGGAAKACVAALKKRGATIAVTGRNEHKAAAFASKNGVELYNPDFNPEGIISCVTQTYIPHAMPKVKFCYDLRYAGQTLQLDCPSVSGLGMLIAQAIYSYSIFLDKKFDNDELKRVYSKVKESL